MPRVVRRKEVMRMTEARKELLKRSMMPSKRRRRSVRSLVIRFVRLVKYFVSLLGVDSVSFCFFLSLTPEQISPFSCSSDIDIYPDFMRLRGKTYDYRVTYQQIKRLFLLPKPDDIHSQLVVNIDPPIRQGQTRYPYLVMQFAKDEMMELDLNLDE